MTTHTSVDSTQANRMLLSKANAVMSDEKRLPNGPFDFGDEQTVGLHMKRVGKNILELGEFDFGLYLGEVDGQWVVGIKDMMTTLPLVGAELFESLEDLKQEWQLD